MIEREGLLEPLINCILRSIRCFLGSLMQECGAYLEAARKARPSFSPFTLRLTRIALGTSIRKRYV